MKPILFIDFDGTLCHDRFWRSLESNERDRVQKYLFEENSSIVSDWMNGKHTSEDVHKIISDDLHIEYQKLWDIFVSDCRTMQVKKEDLIAISNLRKKYHTILITENMDCFDRFTVPSLKLHDYFDYIVNSYNEKLSKSDVSGTLFLKIINEKRADLTKSILIDNSENVCAIFSQLGGTSNLATPKENLYYWLNLLK